MHVTFIIGAGASKAFTPCPYPVLSELLNETILHAKKRPDGVFYENQTSFEQELLIKQRLLLTYALMRAFERPVEKFETGHLQNEKIDKHFELITKEVHDKRVGLDKVFELLHRLESTNYESVTRAHWALTHAVAFYMFQMYFQKQNDSKVDQGHVKLINLIERLLNQNHEISIIDFNYDCLLERVRAQDEVSRNVKFRWEVGRRRRVLKHSDGKNYSESARAGEIVISPDDEVSKRKVVLIKPHGDMCTFLMGKTAIYYRGGRTAELPIALFPSRLADITEHDDYLRTSIMPPTESPRRDSSEFYADEKDRLKVALKKPSIFVIIGWSAGGTDRFYDSIFEESLCQNQHTPRIYFIDTVDIKDRVRQLFGDKSEIESNTSGMSEKSIAELSDWLDAQLPN